MTGELARLTIWGLDNLLGIDAIPLLLSKNYNLPISFLEDEPVDVKDKTFYNKWRSPYGNQKIMIQSRNIIGKEMKYISALATYEYGFGESRSYINDTLLDRDIRVFPQKAPVIFFEFEEKVYCVVEISESQESRLRSHLFGQKRGAKMEDWGDITSKHPLPYEFDSRFFYWLLSKKGQTLTLRGQEINLIDVSALSLLSERNVYNSSSEGPALLDGSLSALSSLSSNESITIIGLKVKVNNTTLQVRFGKDGISIVDKQHCILVERDQSMTTYEDDYSYYVLLLYGFFFPELLKLYDEDITSQRWNTTLEANQRKLWAIKVIKQLMEQNEINETDIQDSFTKDENAVAG